MFGCSYIISFCIFPVFIFPKSKQISSKKKVFFEIFTVNFQKQAKKKAAHRAAFSLNNQ
jgi:hypothetical protein